MTQAMINLQIMEIIKCCIALVGCIGVYLIYIELRKINKRGEKPNEKKT